MSDESKESPIPGGITRRQLGKIALGTTVGVAVGGVLGRETRQAEIDALNGQVSSLTQALKDSQLITEITKLDLAAAQKLADEQNQKIAQERADARREHEKLQTWHSTELKEAQERIYHLELLARSALADEWVRTVSPEHLMKLVRDTPPIAVSNSFLTQIDATKSHTPLIGGGGSGLVMRLFPDNIGIFLTARHFLFYGGQLPSDIPIVLDHFALFTNPKSPISQHSQGIFVPHSLDDIAVVAFPCTADIGPMEFINPDMINYNPDWKPTLGENIQGYSYPGNAYETYVKSVPLTLKVVGKSDNPLEVLCEEYEAPASPGASGTVMFNSDHQAVAILTSTYGRKGVIVTKIPENLVDMIDRAHRTYLNRFREI